MSPKTALNNKESIDRQAQEHLEPEERKSEQVEDDKRRITVDLVQSAQDDLQRLCKQRGISISLAVRQGLALLQLCDPNMYDIVLRPKDRSKPDELVRLLP